MLVQIFFVPTGREFLCSDTPLKKHKIKNTILNWYAYYLLNRQCFINIKRVSISQALKKGTPLLILYKGRVEIIGFADDGSLFIRGKTLRKMYALMQKALDKADLWAKECRLRLSPKKKYLQTLHQEEEDPNQWRAFKTPP